VICKYCGKDRDILEFEIANTVRGKIYRRRKCKYCKAYTQMGRRHKLRSKLNSIRKNLVCSRCGFSDYRALEFHHIDKSTKDFNIGDACNSGLSFKVIQAEIDKCEILCSNFHRIEHYREVP
jgi:hypothetical protein